MAWLEHVHADFSTLASNLAQCLETVVREALVARGQATLALAGGRTPMPAYRELASRRLDWRHVVAIPTDERCVPHGHPACNLREMREAFADAEGLHLVSLTTSDGDPVRSQAHALAMLARHAAPFDAVVLGMGADSHIASLFPGAPDLGRAIDPSGLMDACRIDPDPLPPEAPFPRMTLTAARMLRTRSLHLVITGERKREVLRRAQATNDPLVYPVAAVLHAPQATVHIHWCV